MTSSIHRVTNRAQGAVAAIVVWCKAQRQVQIANNHQVLTTDPTHTVAQESALLQTKLDALSLAKTLNIAIPVETLVTLTDFHTAINTRLFAETVHHLNHQQWALQTNQQAGVAGGLGGSVGSNSPPRPRADHKPSINMAGMGGTKNERGRNGELYPSFKTRLCRHFMREGRCAWGVHCRMAHGQEELRTHGQDLRLYLEGVGRNYDEAVSMLLAPTPTLTSIRNKANGRSRVVARSARGAIIEPAINISKKDQFMMGMTAREMCAKKLIRSEATALSLAIEQAMEHPMPERLGTRRVIINDAAKAAMIATAGRRF